MCGIAGVFEKRAGADPSATVRLMIDALAHRGPDDEGIAVTGSGRVGLGHRRLSIIDLSSAGHQPMVSPSGAELSFNGEIYNFRTVRRDLERAGIRFRSESDTEVLLLALDQWGVAALDRIEGMYALAWWNPLQNELLLARDPLGIKPLYWMKSEERMLFASELKAFKAAAPRTLIADLRSVAQYVDFGFVHHETATALRNVSKVPPGSYVRFRDAELVELRKFWRLPPVEAERAIDAEAAVAEMSAVLETVVEEHLIADVPVGLLLSGGLDSSLIAAMAARHAAVETVTMSFGRSAVDESSHALSVAHHIGSKHHHVSIEPDEIRKLLTDDTVVIDDLFADWGVVSTRVLYRKCRELGMKVVLVGEGSDELFGGYAPFHYALGRGSSPASRFALFRRYSGKRYGRGYFAFSRALQDGEGTTNDLFEQVRRFEVRHQLPNNYVMKVDRASMSVSVEARAPFLDRRVADLALRLPSELLLRAGSSKWILREIARSHDLLPREIASRGKYGASIATTWIDEDPDFRSFARRAILRDGGWSRFLGYEEPMTKFFDEGVEGYPFPKAVSLFGNLAWRLLMLELWSMNLGVEPPR